VEQGFGARVEPMLVRAIALPKSALAPAGGRPSAGDHFASLSAAPTLARGNHYVLIDDIVTKGATLLGAATRLELVVPGARITAFAVMRTMGRVPDIERLLDPWVGKIVSKGNDADRIG
ncbi:MAG: hypothetical protein WCJ30_27620, partial [Deltaproteobacteria bacterium]